MQGGTFSSAPQRATLRAMKTALTSPDGTPASRFAFGTMQFGGAADEAASRAMFDACLDADITHFDTAHLYTDGASETLLGRFAAPHRDRLIIATKAGYSGGAGTANIRAQFDLSRQRLGLDHVDILYLHRFDPDTPLEETMECFADLKSRGQISHVGLSNFAAWQVMKAACIGAPLDLPISILQPMYSLIKRQAEVEILPMAASEGMVVAGYSPLAGGLLTGKYARGETGRLTGATLAVAWAARHSAGPVPIISGRSAEQIAPSLAAIDFTMDDALYQRLAALTPAPPPATDRTEEGA